MIFGELGNDTIQGDGSIDYVAHRQLDDDVRRHADVQRVDPAYDVATARPRRRVPARRCSVDLRPDRRARRLPVDRARRPTARTTSRATAATTSIFGGLGQDDIVGGSSDFFSLTTRRPAARRRPTLDLRRRRRRGPLRDDDTTTSRSRRRARRTRATPTRSSATTATSSASSASTATDVDGCADGARTATATPQPRRAALRHLRLRQLRRRRVGDAVQPEHEARRPRRHAARLHARRPGLPARPLRHEHRQLRATARPRAARAATRHPDAATAPAARRASTSTSAAPTRSTASPATTSIYAGCGNDVLFGDGQDDDIIGGWGNDWISGGTGDDGVLGDDGRIFDEPQQLDRLHVEQRDRRVGRSRCTGNARTGTLPAPSRCTASRRCSPTDPDTRDSQRQRAQRVHLHAGPGPDGDDQRRAARSRRRST